MRKAMAEADVGDDVFGEDPTVRRLQERVAELLGKEAALFTPTGVMANQLAIKAHTEPGNEVIIESDSHIFNYETAAPAMMSQVQLVPVRGERGVMRAEDVDAAVRDTAYYFPKSALVCLENTHNRAGGTIHPLGAIDAIGGVCRARGMKLHIDGARLWNAHIATGTPMIEYAKRVDTVAVCFSKGLGAPAGSMLAGPKDFIARAHRFRKVFGGGMRQVGVLAAAALYALDEHLERLAEDHANAWYFADALSDLRAFSIDMAAVQTNIVILDPAPSGIGVADALARLKARGVLLTPGTPGKIRAVFHLDADRARVQQAVEHFRAEFA
jgi:threonine aldolase